MILEKGNGIAANREEVIKYYQISAKNGEIISILKLKQILNDNNAQMNLYEISEEEYF